MDLAALFPVFLPVLGGKEEIHKFPGAKLRWNPGSDGSDGAGLENFPSGRSRGRIPTRGSRKTWNSSTSIPSPSFLIHQVGIGVGKNPKSSWDLPFQDLGIGVFHGGIGSHPCFPCSREPPGKLGILFPLTFLVGVVEEIPLGEDAPALVPLGAEKAGLWNGKKKPGKAGKIGKRGRKSGKEGENRENWEKSSFFIP